MIVQLTSEGFINFGGRVRFQRRRKKTVCVLSGIFYSTVNLFTKILHFSLFERLPEGALRALVAVVGGPDFTRDEQVLSQHSTFSNRLGHEVSAFVLPSRVDVSDFAMFQRVDHSLVTVATNR